MTPLRATLSRVAGAAIQTLAGARLRLVGTPPQGVFWLYQKSSDGAVYAKKDSGVEVSLEASGAPSGAASGSLGGTYPAPTVAKLNETSGPSALTIGAIADGQTLRRVGATIVGAWIALAYATSPMLEVGAPGSMLGTYTTGAGTVA